MYTNYLIEAQSDMLLAEGFFENLELGLFKLGHYMFGSTSSDADTYISKYNNAVKTARNVEDLRNIKKSLALLHRATKKVRDMDTATILKQYFSAMPVIWPAQITLKIIRSDNKEVLQKMTLDLMKDIDVRIKKAEKLPAH